jgi:hypothetical protein
MSRKYLSADPRAYARRVIEDIGQEAPPVREDAVLDYFGLRKIRLRRTDLAQIPSFCKERAGIDSFLIRQGDTGTIYLAPRKSAERDRMSIFHEVGHFDLPWHGQHSFVCDTSPWSSHSARIEREAFAYASEMLMPLEWSIDYLRGRFTLLQLRKFANAFEASFESAAIKFVKYSDRPCSLVDFQRLQQPDEYGQHYRIRYAVTSRFFPRGLSRFSRIADSSFLDSYLANRRNSQHEVNGSSLGLSKCWTLEMELKYHGPDHVLGLLSMPRQQLGFKSGLEIEHESRAIRPRLIRTPGRERPLHLGSA